MNDLILQGIDSWIFIDKCFGCCVLMEDKILLGPKKLMDWACKSGFTTGSALINLLKSFPKETVENLGITEEYRQKNLKELISLLKKYISPELLNDNIEFNRGFGAIHERT